VVAAGTESGLESLVKEITDSGGEAILFEPIEGYSTTTGDFTDKTIPSFLGWLDRHPVMKWVLEQQWRYWR
jgi:hypothetical protein